MFGSKKLPSIPEPDELIDNEAKNKLNLLKWTEEGKIYFRRLKALRDNMYKLFSVMWSQFSNGMQTKFTQSDQFKRRKEYSYCEWLLLEIKVAYKFDGKRDIYY